MILDLHDQVTISPALPLRRVATYNASALPLELINIPDAFGDAELVGVGVAIVNADGLENSAPCVRRGDQWRVAFAASCLLTYGFVERGVKVTVYVREDGIERSIVLGVGDLEVMRSSPNAEPGDPSKGYVTKGSDRFDKSKVVDGVQHFVKQTMEYDEEMHAWGATWTGDYILEDGEFIPYEAPTGGGVTTAAVALLMLLAPFLASAVTATKEYVDRKDGEIAQAATNYTDSAISQIPAPDFSPSNAVLVATIEATSPAPGDYATVSNKAMTALQSYTETDPTVPGWAKSETQPLPPDYANVSNKATTALQSFTETDPTVHTWAKAANKPTYTAAEVGATTPADVTAAIREQSLGGIWDAELEVWWTPRMRNGSLTYEATTNVNLNAGN